MELFQDDDEDECGDENVRPQRALSADAQCYFGPSMSEEEAALKLADWLTERGPRKWPRRTGGGAGVRSSSSSSR